MIEFNELQKILAKQLRIADASKIQLSSEFKKDLGADSLDLLQLLMRLEDDYGIKIPDETLAGFVTVGDVMGYIEKQN